MAYCTPVGHKRNVSNDGINGCSAEIALIILRSAEGPVIVLVSCMFFFHSLAVSRRGCYSARAAVGHCSDVDQV
jgi:hypothetical protein